MKILATLFLLLLMVAGAAAGYLEPLRRTRFGSR